MGGWVEPVVRIHRGDSVSDEGSRFFEGCPARRTPRGGHSATPSWLSVSSNIAPWRGSRACGSACQRPHTGPSDVGELRDERTAVMAMEVVMVCSGKGQQPQYRSVLTGIRCTTSG